MQIDDEAADEQAENLKTLRHAVEDRALGYATDSDPEVIRATLALRDAIEDIIGQRITFAGEDREPSGTPVATGQLSAKLIRGRATALEIDEMTEGSAAGQLKAEEIAEGADAAATRIRKLGR